MFKRYHFHFSEFNEEKFFPTLTFSMASKKEYAELPDSQQIHKS